MKVWNWIVENHVILWATLLIVLRWIYNAWTPNVTFSQFIRQFIGEIVQEKPTPPLTQSQLKLLAEAGQPVEK